MQYGFYSRTHHPAVNQAVGDFVSDLIWGEPDRFSRFCTMAVADDNQLVGGVVFHGWMPESQTVEISCASLHRKWMTRDIITAAISMPFDVLGCQAIYAHHSEGNKQARHFWNALGASEHVIPNLRGRGKAEVVAVLTAEQWAQSRFNKQKVTCNG